MLKFLILAVSCLGVITAASDADWAVFKAKYAKVYQQKEDNFRRMIFEDNLNKIQSHNELFAKGLKSFYLGENQYLDVTDTEFVKTMNGFKANEMNAPSNGHVFNPKLQNGSLPSEVNWVKKGYVTPVKNQGHCGSCWAFSATGAMEGAHFKTTGKLISLSEKNLIDCSRLFKNRGCEGGFMFNAFEYVIFNRGIDTEVSYPYIPRDGFCNFKRKDVGAIMDGFGKIKSGSEDDLQKAVATVGPVSVAIDASHSSFRFYKGGVYNETACSSIYLDHGVLAVGYGTDDGKAYWLIKNSWGEAWGDKGYIKMSRNLHNQCGIATMASYPINHGGAW